MKGDVLSVLAASFGIEHAPTLSTHSLRKSQFSITRCFYGAKQLGVTVKLPTEAIFYIPHYLTGFKDFEVRKGGRLLPRSTFEPGSTRIINLADDYEVNLQSPREQIAFAISRDFINEITDEADCRRVGDFACEGGTVDPMIAQLGATLLSGFDDPAALSALFVDHIALALTVHLARKYGGLRKPVAQLRGGLSPRQAERAKEYLMQRIVEDVSLADVAAEVGLSRSHFTRGFRMIFGLSPYQWLLQKRIELAKTMLREPIIPISMIALEAGFADQSHFTRIFTRIEGISPGAWRRRVT